MFQVNPLKNQALFSSKDKNEKLKCCLLPFLFSALRVKYLHKNLFSGWMTCDFTSFSTVVQSYKADWRMKMHIQKVRALVAQWVKRWPTDPVVPDSSPARGQIFSTVNGVPLHTAFHDQLSHGVMQ